MPRASKAVRKLPVAPPKAMAKPPRKPPRKPAKALNCDWPERPGRPEPYDIKPPEEDLTASHVLTPVVPAPTGEKASGNATPEPASPKCTLCIRFSNGFGKLGLTVDGPRKFVVAMFVLILVATILLCLVVVCWSSPVRQDRPPHRSQRTADTALVIPTQ